MELIPGNRVHRYSVSFREPYLLGLDYAFSSNGYYYRRVFPNYDEERLGGRFGLSRRITPTIGAAANLRVENVEITDPREPAPADLIRVLGDNFVLGFGASINHDTRDSFLSPSCGHFIEASFEQVVGDFDYPRVTLSGRQFWLLRSRGDGSGKHILSARGEFGYTGNHTPIYDRFYAGGFQTIRGFDYRGVGPTEFGVEVGGQFSLLTGLEYQFPITPDDSLSGVLFVDAGTVERKLEINDYRVAAGFGFRIQVPQMGPVPLAFDFAFPIVKTDEDDTQIFSFFVGLFR
jgi:outer membrane protein insertion porin family